MSQNEIQPDDPRLTAYALGELDPTEQESLEQLLFDSPEAQAAVREIRELAGLLATELRQEPVAGLTAAQRSAIFVAGLVVDPVAALVAVPAADRPAAEAAHEPASHVVDQANSVALQPGLPEAPVQLSSRWSKHRSSSQSVIRFASLATIAALVVVVAVMLPPSRPQADLPLEGWGEARFDESQGLGMPFDLAMQQRKFGDASGETGLSHSESLMSNRLAELDETAPTDEYAKSTDSLFIPDGRSPAVAGGGAVSTSRPQLRSGIEPSQKIARNEPAVEAGRGRSSSSTTESTPMSAALGRGLAKSDNKPHKPQSGIDRLGERNLASRRSAALPGRQAQESREDGKPRAVKAVTHDHFGINEPSKRNMAQGVPQTGPQGGQVPAAAPLAGAQPADQKSKVVAGKPVAQLHKPAGTTGGRPGSPMVRFNYVAPASEPDVALQEAEVVGAVRKGDVAESKKLTEQLAQQAGDGSQPYFSQKINTYNRLLKEKRFDDAIVIGKQMQAQMPDNPLPELMVAKARDAKQGAKNQDAREANADISTKQLLADLDDTVHVESVPELGVLVITGNQSDVEAVQDVLHEIDRVNNGTVGIEYPTLEKLKELSARRQRYKRLEAPGTEVYEPIVENLFFSAYEDPLSTFGVDVDTASYANVRRFLTDQQLPPPNAVRIEELVNYFSYDYAPPAAGQPFAVNVEAANCAWSPGHQLVRIALKAREISRDQRPASNLVFLVDVSGSMQAENKLPLVKHGLNLITKQMTESDQVAIVTYSDSAVQRLESTNGTNKQQILAVIDSLQAAGSTNGADGIQLAYRAALDHFIGGGTNRVILCTDGDFNVGVTDDNALVQLIQERARTKVFFSVFGFGMGNLNDGKLEKLADKGNGHYAYIDGQREAQKMFVDELVGTLVTVAKDVKLQVEFNPNQVGAYRLIGYENRVMASHDFNNDKKDAGDIGAGHSVTALYEIIPADAAPKPELGDSLRYRKALVPQEGEVARELLTVKLRYKLPEGDTSTLLEFPAAAAAGSAGQGNNAKNISPSASREFNWAAAVAAFGMILRESRFRGQANFDMVQELAQGAKGDDRSGQRAEFIELVKMAKALYQPETTPAPAANPPLTLTREQAEVKAGVNGKYHNLLRIVPAAEDAASHGSFSDYGRWEGTSYLSHNNLPPGYWVYVAPNWYIWGDAK